MAKNFKNLLDKMPLEARGRAEAKAMKMLGEMHLDELREALQLTQQHLAELLKINQSAVSKMEHRTDMYVSTLQHMIKAMGGSLEIRAIFPEGVVHISQFNKVA